MFFYSCCNTKSASVNHVCANERNPISRTDLVEALTLAANSLNRVENLDDVDDLTIKLLDSACKSIEKARDNGFID